MIGFTLANGAARCNAFQLQSWLKAMHTGLLHNTKHAEYKVQNSAACTARGYLKISAPATGEGP